VWCRVSLRHEAAQSRCTEAVRKQGMKGESRAVETGVPFARILG
jgi:hypothetical protein